MSKIKQKYTYTCIEGLNICIKPNDVMVEENGEIVEGEPEFQIHNRIKLTGRNKQGDQHIWFNVPEYIFGEALYEKGDCIAYLVHQLQENGFNVKYIHPNTLFVSWNQWVPLYVRNEFKKKTGKVMNEKGEISDPKREETDNQDPNYAILNQGQPSTVPPTTKDSSKYLPVDKYKRRFVYNPDILEKIEKKVYHH